MEKITALVGISTKTAYDFAILPVDVARETNGRIDVQTSSRIKREIGRVMVAVGLKELSGIPSGTHSVKGRVSVTIGKVLEEVGCKISYDKNEAGDVYPVDFESDRDISSVIKRVIEGKLNHGKSQ